jgi:hypothetical protein
MKYLRTIPKLGVRQEKLVFVCHFCKGVDTKEVTVDQNHSRVTKRLVVRLALTKPVNCHRAATSNIRDATRLCSESEFFGSLSCPLAANHGLLSPAKPV